jgi:hydrogenase nickel incorporation protein HypB
MDTKEVKVMQKILKANDLVAKELREELKEKEIFYMNLMSSPGSGKTTLMEATAKNYDGKITVIEGDIQTTLDAERLAKLGVQSYQINTGVFGGDCHLESSWIKSALEEIELDGVDALFVENIGNLVCPAEFDVGAHVNTILLSVTEGADKPLKYPLAFRVSQLCIITKTDLLPYLDIDMEDIRKNVKSVNPDMKIIEIGFF